MPSLLIAADCLSHVHLIVGHNPLASSRASRSLELGASVIVLAPKDAVPHYGLQQKIDEGLVRWVQKETVTVEDLTTLGRSEVDGVVDAVFVTLQVGCAQSMFLSYLIFFSFYLIFFSFFSFFFFFSFPFINFYINLFNYHYHPLCIKPITDKFVSIISLDAHISALCKKIRIPVNVADSPSLCTFTLLSTYTDGPLQIGVTTSGRGCKLAARIQREIVSSLPPQLGDACDRLGKLRRRIWEEDFAHSRGHMEVPPVEEDDYQGQAATFNKLVLPQDSEAVKGRRIRWLSQMCEYWPLEKLCTLKEEEIDGLLQSYNRDVGNEASEIVDSDTTIADGSSHPPTPPPESHAAELALPQPPPDKPRIGKILLVGSGPGHPDLLTTAALNAIKTADLILADKLVPPPVLSLIPRRTPVHIARKFPGNADAAQGELLSLGLAALKEGKRVVRLKQGDPYIYGRGGEEHIFFSKHGFTPSVVPGITSALSSGIFAGIPLTHRGVADQVLICTGTGRKGEMPVWPEYIKGRTTVLLMALHRLGDVVEGLKKKGWTEETRCAVVERASCTDQRVVRSTLGSVVAAIEEVGSRPPGLLVVGEACGVLQGPMEKGQRWAVEEGFVEY